MPDVASVLKEEIIRLARSEIKKQIDPLNNRVQELNKTVTQQKKQIAVLEKSQSRAAKKTSSVAQPVDEENSSSARITIVSIKSHRKRLNLSQREMGLLLGVSTQTIIRWEVGKGIPRGDNKDAFFALRDLGRRDIKKKLEELAG